MTDFSTLQDVATMGVIAVIALGILFGIVQAVLSYLAQRNLSDLHSLGMQAIIGTNEIQIVDEAMERRNKTQ